MSRPAPVLLVAILLALPATAATAADDGPTPPASTVVETAPPGRWYGWELMASDLVFMLVANDGRSGSPELGLGSHQFAFGLGGLVIGAPALHYLHGNTRRAAIGLAVRAAVVGIYALADDALRTPSSNNQVGDGDIVMAGLLFAAIIGGPVFVFIDDVWHARVPPPEAPSPRRTVAPTLIVSQRGGGLGLVGTF